MGIVRAGVEVPGPVPAAEALWYDLGRWPSFMEGFAAVVRREGGWPAEGGRLVWDSGRAGRGRVVERVVAHEPGGGQTAEIEDPRVRGTQRVAFADAGDGRCRVTLELDYALKDRTPLVTPLVDRIFVRRALGDALHRTLARFAAERATDAELS